MLHADVGTQTQAPDAFSLGGAVTGSDKQMAILQHSQAGSL
jgi:hypothetical protein